MRGCDGTRSVTPTLRAALVLAAVIPILSCAEPAPVPDLSGTWAELQLLSEFATLPLVGEVARTTTVALRVLIEQTGNLLAVRFTYCATDIVNGSGLSAAMALTTIPDAFLASLGEVAAHASVEPSDRSPRFVQPWLTEVRGARLADPERDALPTAADDPRVIDQDGDGKPGLTVHVRALGIVTGDVYVVQRVRTRLVGAVVSPDRVEGLVEWTTEQVTVGATNPLFLGTLPSHPNPVEQGNSFVLARIDPTWGCEEVFEAHAGLFAVR